MSDRIGDDDAEDDNGEYVHDEEAGNRELLEWWATERFRRSTGRRIKTSWDSYIAQRIKLAWPKPVGRRFRRLPMPIRAFLNIQLIHGTIGNGGVEYFLGPNLPRGGRYGEYARDLRVIGSVSCAAGLEDIYQLFPGGMPPLRWEFRTPLLERLLDKYHDTFARVSAAFWNNSDADYRKAAMRLLHAPHLLRPAKARPDPEETRVYYRPL